MLFGTTGTGKSTLANALIQGPGNITYFDGLYDAKELRHNGKVVFKIGHEVRSETKAPKFHPVYDDQGEVNFFLVDGPGINDNNLNNEFANQTAIKEVLKSSSSFVLLLIMDAN